jgi:TonB-linked SusC/RagA family outer membrane protein
MKNKLINKDIHRSLKILIMMKTMLVMTVFLSVQVFGTVYSQNKRLTLKLHNANVSDLFDQIESQSNFRFLYYDDLVKDAPAVNIEVKNEVVENILSQALRGSDLNFKVLENNLVVISKSEMQQFVVKGKVFSAGDNAPLVGATVVQKGTTNGTITDANGEYTITLPDQNSVLVFSFVGYITQEVAVGGRNVIDVSLVQDIIGLDELIVIGYGYQKKSDLTGSVASVKGEEIQNLSANSINQLLQGRVSGVYVAQSEGKPGDGADIIIRGAGSINGVAPLYIIDGIRGPSDNALNVRDIESIEILKDASAAAIYGAEAAHGVVLITTKKGKQGKAVVNFNASYGNRKPIGLPDMLQTKDYITKKREAWLNDDPGRVIDPSFVPTNPAWPNTDWKDIMFGGKGAEQNYDFSVSGGSEKMTYYISSNYKREDGIMVDNWFERYAGRVNTEFKVSDKVRVGENLMVSKRKINPNDDDGRDLLKIFRAVPTMEVYDPSNPYGGWGKTPIYFQGGNPLGFALQRHQITNIFGVNGSAYVEIEPFANLKVRGTVGFDLGSNDYNRFEEAYDYGAIANPTARLMKDFRNFETYTGVLTVSYDKSFGKHDLGLLAGYEALKGDDRGFFASRSGFPPLSGVESFDLGISSDFQVSGGPGYNRILSQFGRLNYSYAGKYLLQANIRRDGNHKFGPENKWGIFPSFSAGWKLSEEDFLSGVAAISNLKLRASYGTLGSDAAIPPYLYSTTYTSRKIHYFYTQNGSDRDGGYSAYNMPNNAIKWESMQITNLGIDFGLFQNKLSGSVEYYIKNTKDMIFNVEVPLASGIGVINDNPGSIPTNIGKMRNSGWDFGLLYQNRFGGLSLNIGANASFNTNEITKLYKENSVLNDGGAEYMDGSICRTEVGQPMGYFYGYIVEGIFQTQVEVDAANALGAAGPYQEAATAPGDFKYKDIASFDANGKRIMQPDGKIDEADKTFIGNPWPKMIYGLNLNAEYKGIDMTLFFQGVSGVDIYHATKCAERGFKGDWNSTTDIFDAWSADKPTQHPRLTANDPNGNLRKHSSYFVEDGSYLKLRTLQIGYTLPSSVTSRLFVSKLRIYFNAQNLFTLTKYTGMDPELGGGVRTRGIEGMDLYPKTRLMSFGVDVTF